MIEEFDKALIMEARKGINMVSFCGHHCHYCFLAYNCGGCRSTYNCCSFATLFPDGICPNVKCVKQKKLEGCYYCNELDGCKKGYYGRENEYVAKATALFIREYGEKCYTETLQKVIDACVDYPKAFDLSGGVSEALDMLKRYL